MLLNVYYSTIARRFCAVYTIWSSSACLGCFLFSFSVGLCDCLFKSEHAVVHQVISLCVGVVRVGMMTVEKLDDVKAAAVDVKMDIALLKIRCDGFPYLDLRKHPLNFAPCGVADTLAVNARRNEKQLQR